MTAKTGGERQEALRKRRAGLGQKELRGIWVTDAEEIEIKKKIRAMLKRMRKGS